MQCTPLLRKSLYLIPLFAMIATLFGPVWQAQGATKVSVIKATSWVQSADQRQQFGTTKFSTSRGVKTETYESNPYKVEFDYNAVASKWDVAIPDGSSMRLWVSTSSSGKAWSDWRELQRDDSDPNAIGQHFGKLMVTNGRYIRYRMELGSNKQEQLPNVSAVHFTFINSEQGPSASDLATASHDTAEAAAPMPRIITRSEWGADESLRFDDYGREKWPREYTTPRKIILHDTETANNDPNPPATVRAIYYYHAIVRGWGDIGYNYLVDEQGNIYEGRAGGPGVVGGHARCFNYGTVGIAALGNHYTVRPSAAMLNSIENVSAWIAGKYHINPFGHGVLGSYAPKDIPNIAGHRDLYGVCGNTHTDPGYYLYILFPQIRSAVAQRMGSGSLPSGGSESFPGGRVMRCKDTNPVPPGLTYKVAGTHGTGLNLHACPDTSSRTLANIPDGTVIHEIPSDRDGWVKTRYRGRVGYVWNTYLRAVKATSPRKTAKRVTTPQGRCIDKTPKKQEPVYRVYRTNGHGLYLRECPSMKSRPITIVPEGTVVHEITSKVDGWVMAKYHGRIGYMWYQYLKVIKKAPTSNASILSGDSYPVGGKVVIKGTPGALNLRVGPGMNYRRATKMWEGSTVTVMGAPRNGWYPVRYTDGFGNPYTGWAWGEYLKPANSHTGQALGATSLAGAMAVPIWRRRRKKQQQQKA